MSATEEYIEQRKKQAGQLSEKFLEMQKYPIENDKIVFSAFEGDGGFCCNPRYIAEALHRKRPDCRMIWLTKDVTRAFPDYIEALEYTEENIAYHLSTARVWVDNYRKPFGTLKRDGQLYIQTWHASLGFKAVGLFRGAAFPEIARLVSEWDSNLIDYMISNSDYCDKIYPKKILYNGPTIRSGSPRVDCLINDKKKLHHDIRMKYNLTENTKLLLYAPTFRGGNQRGRKCVVAPMPSVDFDRLISALNAKTGDNWKVVLKLHPQLAAIMDEMPLPQNDNRLIDVSKEPDISFVMGGCDAVLTDYSSCAFDAAFAGIPVFLYADDVESYIENRGRFMWKEDELPFPMAQSNDELEDCIMKFDITLYRSKCNEFMALHGVNETGNASGFVADFIIEKGGL